MPRNPGEQFAGYTIIELIGRGGMGEIYLARHPHLPRNEALKVLPGELSRDPMYRQRFVREAEHASSVVHPSIVTIFNSGEYDGHLWIAMEFIDGIDGLKLLRKHPQGLPKSTVIAVARAVGAALDKAHSAGLLHRDVKPANILLQDAEGPDPRVLLADFGIAKSQQDVSNLTSTNMFLGTVAYAAPEQLLGDPVDGRADQYSLAATVFELLTGRPPFHGATSASVIAHHLHTVAPRPSTVRPEISPAADQVFARALAKSAADRYDSCAAFAAALADALDAAPTATPPRLQKTLPPVSPPAPPRAVAPPRSPGAHAGAQYTSPQYNSPQYDPGQYGASQYGVPSSGPTPVPPTPSAPAPAPQRGSGLLIGLSVVAVVLLVAVVAGVIWVGKGISDANHADKASTSAPQEPSGKTPPSASKSEQSSDADPATRTPDPTPQAVTGPTDITPGECVNVAQQTAGTVLVSRVDCDSTGLNFYAASVISAGTTCASTQNSIITFPSSSQKLCLTPNFYEGLCYQVPLAGSSLADYQEVSCSGSAARGTLLARVTTRSDSAVSCASGETRWSFTEPESIGYCLVEQ